MVGFRRGLGIFGFCHLYFKIIYYYNMMLHKQTSDKGLAQKHAPHIGGYNPQKSSKGFVKSPRNIENASSP
jgi:hypothetical protein